MGLFNFKNRKEMKNKLMLINNVTEVEKIVTEAKLFTVSNNLNKIIDLLDNPDIKLDNVQITRINSELETIKKYSTKGYEELLKNKCSSITEIIKRDKICLEVNDASNANEEKIYRFLGEQTELTSQINSLTGKMDNVLGKDKSMWQLLNMQRNTLYNRLAIISKNYSTILTAQSNLFLANDVRKAKKEAEEILSQASLIDASEFEDNASFVTQINDEVFETSNKINDSFAKNFGSNNDDYSYEKSLEKKALTVEVTSTNIGEQEGDIK